jgi:hypothetical protein
MFLFLMNISNLPPPPPLMALPMPAIRSPFALMIAP